MRVDERLRDGSGGAREEGQPCTEGEGRNYGGGDGDRDRSRGVGKKGIKETTGKERRE